MFYGVVSAGAPVTVVVYSGVCERFIGAVHLEHGKQKKSSLSLSLTNRHTRKVKFKLDSLEALHLKVST